MTNVPSSLRRSLVRATTALAAAALLVLAPLVASGSASTAASAPSNSVPPAISGPAAAGGVLTASTGTWSGDTPITFAFQWRLCDGNGAGCADVAGATGQTYAIPAGDVGHSLRVAVTATNGTGSGRVVSAPTAAILTASRPANTAPPAVSGTARQGSTLTTSDGSWSGNPPPTFHYGWLRCNSTGGSCTTISDAAARTYSLSSADVGATLRSIVVASNSAGDATATSSATAVIASLGNGPHPTSQPDISGTLAVGHTLTAGTGKTWTGSSPISYSFFWQRCDSAGRCTTISAATNQTYGPTNADVGFRLRAVVTGRNAYGSASIATNLTAAPIAGAGPKPALVTAPVVSGTALAGSTLQTTTGTWRTTSGPTFAYAWLRCDTHGGACSTIAGAHDKTYRLTSADTGHTIRSQITATTPNGATSATSAATGTVGTTPPGVVKLPSGGVSVPAANVSLPERLVISGVNFTPIRLTSRAPFVAQFKVNDTHGDAVRDALVYVVALPYGLLRPAEEVRTDMSGIATITLVPTANLGLRRGAIVMFVRARKEGGSLLGGISTRRLVQIRVGG